MSQMHCGNLPWVAVGPDFVRVQLDDVVYLVLMIRLS